MSDIISRLRDAYMRNPASALALLPELFEANVMELPKNAFLSMLAGARAIDNSPRCSGRIYVYDIFGTCGEPQEISYYEAADTLRQMAAAEQALKEAEK